MKKETNSAALTAAPDKIENPEETSELVLLAPEKVHFKREQSGYLTLDYEGKTYEKVTLTRLIPFESDETYISVSYNNAEDEWTRDRRSARGGRASRSGGRMRARLFGV